ncbi:PREDICTED: uncharacterized protein LOC104801720 [Tarenaya hassleriana]|uniref:uncharacterized protein LOC104801720 n=1 Tax=Tarenaya hassleriana TaxID=28532 RepID=UPI00053C764D|nr:PREDICTED: uncharacterized protein LOC104801720 [Tarenaya hassleriana]
MTGDSCEVGSKEARPALCDMTNLPSKRGISSMLGDYLLKSGDESGKNVVREDQGVKFSKRLCLVVEDLVKENSRGSDSKAGSSSFEDKSSSGGSPLNGGSVNIELVAGKDPGDSKDASNALDVAGVQSFKGDSDDAAVEITGGDGHELKESCISSSSVQVSLENVEKKDHGQASNVASNAKKCSEGEGLPNSQNCRSFEMSRCSTVDRMEHVNHNMGTDMLKSCTCSFCLKAAYIWSDLHYQDIKGRLSVLKKSQKEEN